MSIASSTQPSLRTRILPRFPANVLAGSGISIVKSGGTYIFSATPLALTNNQLMRDLQFTVYQNGSVLTTGIKGDLFVPFSGTIIGATLLADQSGSVQCEVWKDSFTNAPPTVADKISGSTPLTLAAAAKSRDTTLSGWSTVLNANDVIRFNFNSVATITRLQIALDIRVN